MTASFHVIPYSYFKSIPQHYITYVVEKALLNELRTQDEDVWTIVERAKVSNEITVTLQGKKIDFTFYSSYVHTLIITIIVIIIIIKFFTCSDYME